jgi:hypothetical protein
MRIEKLDISGAFFENGFYISGFNSLVQRPDS